MFAIIINEQGYKSTFVVLDENKQPQFYTLKNGESIIEKDWQIANSLLKAKWDFNNEVWVEGATEEEILEWEEANKIEICPEKTVDEKVADLEVLATEQSEYSVDLDFRLSMIEISL